ncbi:Cytochrome c [Cyclobacterium lianum]|uniref:Cytochrome c n=1 Tax=Cyclobacterium lianum TaxID=388280 RepID=A0A1M7JTP2_9BACT|nr:cytochrome c [Cyclobacterium lianum]SHM55917.1 Cytochrome c [Cyclobacterium lianum]
MFRIKSNKTLSKTSNGLVLFIVFCGGLLISSCTSQERGFALPEGDIELGKAAFTKLACNACHSISGIAWQGKNDGLRIPLGGEVSSQKTYGELVTSVINPSHKIGWVNKNEGITEDGRSRMKNYNELMTVQELIDLVAFLQSEYKVTAPATDYHPYLY